MTPPGFDENPGLLEGVEDFSIQELVAQPRVEALDVSVLPGRTRESLAIRARRKLSSADVTDVLTDLFVLRGIPAYIRSDNGPEFVAGAVRQWIAAVGARPAQVLVALCAGSSFA